MTAGAEEAEVALGDVDAVELLRMVAGEVEAGAGQVVGGHLLEDAGLPLVGVELGNAGEEIVGQDGGIEKFDHAVGVGIAERLEQHCVDDAEDGGVGPDAQGQRGHGGEGEGGILAEHEERVFDVVPEIAHGAYPTARGAVGTRGGFRKGEPGGRDWLAVDAGGYGRCIGRRTRAG